MTGSKHQIDQDPLRGALFMVSEEEDALKLKDIVVKFVSGFVSRFVDVFERFSVRKRG